MFKKNNQGSCLVILRKRDPERDRELLLCGKEGNNSHPTVFSPSFLLTLSPPSPLCLPIRQPPACHPSAAALLSSFAVFLTLSSSLATAVFSWEKEPWTFCKHRGGQGSASAHGWWLTPVSEWDTVQLQGNNFCTELWLRPETGGAAPRSYASVVLLVG